MTVKEYMKPANGSPAAGVPVVRECSHPLEALALWSGAGVCVADDAGRVSGRLEADDMLCAVADAFGADKADSLVEVVCGADVYSASRLAMAVEDADAPLLGIWCRRTTGNRVEALLRIGSPDPSAACRSIRRYGYQAMPLGGKADADLLTAQRNVDALRMILEI